MKFQFLFFGMVLLAASSCTKKTSACINGPTQVEEYNSGVYTWCGSNADNIEWSMNGSGTLGTGNSFTPNFAEKGKGTYIIVAKGTNKKYEKSTTIQVSYGRFPSTSCGVTNSCGNGNTNLPNDAELTKYKGYVYQSKSDWGTDIINGNHRLAEDSTNLTYDNTWQVASFIFKKNFTVGNKKLISVEYRDPLDPQKVISNWGNIFYNQSPLIEIKYSGFTEASENNSGVTTLDIYSKKFITNLLTGKWKLTKITSSSVEVPLDCKSDDYLKFNADGTWRYEVGTDNCNNTATATTGTYHIGSACSSYFSGTPTTVQGTFGVSYFSYSANEIVISINNANYIKYYFTY